MMVALAATGHVLVGAYGPRPDLAARQSLTDALESEIESGAAVTAQQEFPEGEFFSHVLTGISQARLGGADNLDRARAHLAALQEPAVLARFGEGLVPEHGVFALGWSLQLAVDIARASGTSSDVAVAVGLASRVSAALERYDSPYLPSYPGQFWPCDTVVAVAGLVAALELPGLADPDQERWLTATWRWLDTVRARQTADGILLPHRVDAAGEVLEGPRGSSQAIIQTFWPIIDPADATTWDAFVSAFVTREAGLVGVREHPRGVDGQGDVDSGPLVAGVSLSASAVALGAAIANGDAALADSLAGEAEVFGLPSRLGPRRYALGLAPIGEAFLAFSWSRAPQRPTVPSRAPLPAWPLWWGSGLVVAGVAAYGLSRTRRSPHAPVEQSRDA